MELAHGEVNDAVGRGRVFSDCTYVLFYDAAGSIMKPVLYVRQSQVRTVVRHGQ